VEKETKGVWQGRPKNVEVRDEETDQHDILRVQTAARGVDENPEKLRDIDENDGDRNVAFREFLDADDANHEGGHLPIGFDKRLYISERGRASRYLTAEKRALEIREKSMSMDSPVMIGTNAKTVIDLSGGCDVNNPVAGRIVNPETLQNGTHEIGTHTPQTIKTGHTIDIITPVGIGKPKMRPPPNRTHTMFTHGGRNSRQNSTHLGAHAHMITRKQKP
jgi:hypothetical protein